MGFLTRIGFDACISANKGGCGTFPASLFCFWIMRLRRVA